MERTLFRASGFVIVSSLVIPLDSRSSQPVDVVLRHSPLKQKA